MSMNELVIDDLLGVRFKNHGRSIEEGFDCYGLAIEVSRRLGHELYDLWYKKSSTETFSENYEEMCKKMSSKIEETSVQELGNLILFAENGRMTHIGVILEENIFIHADYQGVRVMRIDDYYRKEWKVYKWLR